MELANYYCGVLLPYSQKTEFYSVTDLSLKKGDHVVINSSLGLEMARVSTDLIRAREEMESLPSILRKADAQDLAINDQYLELNKKAQECFIEEVKKLTLPMQLLYSTYTLDGDKCLFAFVSDGRVDFRDLLKALASELHCRIELRQIMPRDRAKISGGVGICGLPLCCSNFLARFDGIGVFRLKNQMLSLNTQKFSGPCGKLKCCLLFEDDLYIEEKKKYPPVGSIIRDGQKEYQVDSYNILSRTITLKNDGESRTISLNELSKMNRH